MPSLEEFASNEQIKQEYRKTFLLNLFRKFCVRLGKDATLKNTIKKIYRESYDKIQTTTVIIKREFKYDMSIEESQLMCKWIIANLTKSSTRKGLSLELKQTLYKKQHGKCMACGEPLGNDWGKIHVDHIIPFKLVGDELDDNYQDLCETCNECKSASTDYIFRTMINLN